MYLIMQGHEKWKWSIVLYSDFTTETYWFNHPKKAFKFAVSKAPQCNEKKLPYCEWGLYIICCSKNRWYTHILDNTHKCTGAEHAYFEAVQSSGFYSEWDNDIWSIH